VVRTHAGLRAARERELGFQGVYRIPPDGGDPELVVDRDEYEQPNGLCFSPDKSLLYVNDTAKARIKVYDVNADGSSRTGGCSSRESARALSTRASPTG
jgi:sugar lactone lactonase YvrE